MIKLFSKLALMLTVQVVFSCSQSNNSEIWMIGDSTMAAKSERRFPESGWGEGLKTFVKSSVKVHNHAASGRSTLSFINEGRWDNVLDSLQKGDFIIIQFGHNDEKEDSTLHTVPFGTFKDNLVMFAKKAKSKGAIPIICSSIVRRQFDENNVLIDTHGDYIPAAKEAAMELGISYVDMEKLSKGLVTEMGVESSKQIYNFHGKKKDSTHPNQKGAKVFASLFVKDALEQQLSIIQCFDVNNPELLWYFTNNK